MHYHKQTVDYLELCRNVEKHFWRKPLDMGKKIKALDSIINSMNEALTANNMLANEVFPISSSD